ncbi:MAG: NAD(P)-dependent glycerol-3-phosphate dehydrogenase [Caldisericia bacterium]|nr:NAD(P)-dependent glycerol-3-phosphate dehydrogenase [Caldisericia bacterium]MDD4614186.1 NAD(P)-dependent glycerol-3-phosphate dehydrogenase [Caldisericia bacterium]
MNPSAISVLGAGAWGTTMGRLLAKKGVPITLWTHESAVEQEINQHHENRSYLQGVPLPKEMVCTTSIEEAVQNKHLILIAQPSKFIPALVSQMKPFLSPKTSITILTKGLIHGQKVQLLADYFAAETSLSMDRIFVLSGPNFAIEIAHDLPACTTLAGVHQARLEEFQTLFSQPQFRVYANTDMIGVQLGGPMKNVIAVVAGILAGMNIGQNIHAALLIRGTQEMKRLLSAIGANDETIYGLACLGDLILTSSSSKSRNYWAGLQLAQGTSPEYLVKESGKTIEGIDNLEALISLAESFHVEMPISMMLQNVLFHEKNPQEGIYDLMNRQLKYE